MITKVVGRKRHPYTNAIVKEVSLYFGGPNEFQLQPIEGIGPVKAEIVKVASPFDPGTRVLNARTGDRNIVLTVEFNPEYGVNSTVTMLRQELYGVFLPGDDVELEFDTDHMGVMLINGVIEAHEVNIFSKDPVVQISIICGDPYFRDTLGETTVAVPGGVREFSIDYAGTAPVGFKWEYQSNSTQPTGPTLMMLPSSRYGYLQLDYPHLNNDNVKFSTIADARLVSYQRTGITRTGLGYFEGNLAGMFLKPGLNYFDLSNPANVRTPVIKYSQRFEGL